MAYVQSSRGKKYELLTSFGEEPTVHIESEGDKLIRNLSAKQLDTNLTLQKQRKLEKEFERGSGFVPLSVHNAGSSTLQELRDKVTKVENIEKLQILGLTLKEANAVLNGEDLSFPDSKIETSVKTARAEYIKTLIENGKNRNVEENCKEREVISRHEKELALAVKPESTETKLLQFALSCQNQKNVEDDFCPPDHPINQLHELERSLFCKHDPLELVKTVKRKRRQFLEACLPPQGPKFMKKPVDGKKRTLWDKEEYNTVRNHSNKEVQNYSCKKETFYTIKNGKIVEIDNKKNKFYENVKINHLEKNNVNLAGVPFVNTAHSTSPEREDRNKNNSELLPRLTEGEIKNFPRFKNYEKGDPSNVLYIKNLASNFKEDDLVLLFKTFQRSDHPSFIYRLMTGKMRGQAFVTFPSKEIAKEALNGVNGIIVKGKPIVVQFGKS